MFSFKKKKRASPKKSLSRRLFRSVVSVIVLTAFVLGLSLTVSKLAKLDTGSSIKAAASFLTRIGLPENAAETAEQVAGDFAERLLSTNIAPSKNYEEQQLTGPSVQTQVDEESAAYADSRQLLFKVALIGDSEENFENLKKALDKISTLTVHSVFFLGDYTKLGELDALYSARELMNDSDLIYYSLPGDRDLYQSVGEKNYNTVFGIPEVSVQIGPVKFVMLDNSTNYTPIPKDKIGQYKTEIKDANFVISSQPLYHPLASYGKPVMGLVQGEEVKEVKDQANDLLSWIRDSEVKAIVSGDHHTYSRNADTERSNLEHIVIGAVTPEKASQSKTSITILSIYEDMSYVVEEIPF